MAKVFDITPTGASAASLAENRSNLDARQREAFGEDLSMSPQTPQSMWSGIAALGLTEVGEQGVRAALFGSSVDHAEGVFLDAIGSLLDINRLVATRSRVTVTMTGVAGTGVPQGSRAKTDPDGDEFRTLADAVLSPAGITVEMEAVEEGPVEASSGTLTVIVTVIAGWETITNTADASAGIARQSDANFRASFLVRTAHSSIGPMPALEAALDEAGSLKTRVTENNTDIAAEIQGWTLRAHSILVVAQSGSDGDIRRSIENHRGLGVGVNTAIIGATPDDAALTAITNGTVTWNGTDYTGLDLSGTSTPAEKATELTTLLEGTALLPASGVTVIYLDGIYRAIYGWLPDVAPNFGTGSTEDAFGLDADNNAYPAGPFVRPTERALVVGMDLERGDGFPADGLSLVREGVLARVRQYGVGVQLWSNDLLTTGELIAGTRITAITVQYDSTDVSGVAVPLTNLWTLTSSDLTITVT